MTSSLWIFLSPAMPEIILAVGTCLLLLMGAIHRTQDGLVDFLSRSLVYVVLLFVLLQPTTRTLGLNELVISDTFAIFFKILILGFGGLVLTISRKTVDLEHLQSYEYPILVLFALLGMMLMVSSMDLLTLFLGLELQSLSLYILTAMRRSDARASEAGLKYFVLGALSTGILLFGVSLVYGYTGTTDYQVLGQKLTALPTIESGLWVGMVFIFVGLAFKISAVPFHMWTPDVYEGAPTSVTTLLATVPKLAAFGLLIRLLVGPFASLVVYWSEIATILAVASMVLGAFAALVQQNFKRLIAYSAIGNMGYALIGLVGGSVEGIRSTLVYLFLYSLMTLGIFACLLNLTRRGKVVEQIQELRGLIQSSPGTTFVMAFLLFSMAGLPPMAGFIGKLYIFQAAVFQGFYTLAIIGVITSVVGAAYYLYVIKVMVMESPKGKQAIILPLRRDPFMSILLGSIVLLLTLIFLNPSPLASWALEAVNTIWKVK